MNNINEYIDYLKKRKSKMVDYLLLKVSEEDWHGVADAAMDIRDIESERIGAETVHVIINDKKE